MSNRVLVISYVATMASTPNGRTMQSLLQGIPVEDKSLFCCYGVPDAGSCDACYKVSNKNALLSLIKRYKVGGPINTKATASDTSLAITADTRKGTKKSWKYLAKEWCWKLGGWKNEELKTWLLEQNADCIVYMYGDNASLQNFAVFAARFLNIPLIVYSCEDYCFKDYNYIDNKDKSLAFKLYQKMSKKATEKLFKQAFALITNSDDLGEEYNERYGIDKVKTVMMASQMEFIENAEIKPIEQMHIDYLGAIGDYRTQALVQIGEALQRIDKRLKLDVYGRINDDNLKTQLESCPGIRYQGFVSYEQVQQVMRTSSLLIEAINDDPYVHKDKRYGFSTKYADCFACGTPFLVYAPEVIIETRFAQEHECAFVATSEKQLEEQLKNALFDEHMRRTQLKKAKEITERYFDKNKNIETVNKLINEATEK